MRLRTDAVAIFQAALAAVEPGHLVAKHVRRNGPAACVEVDGRAIARWRPPTLIIGAGKAAARMAASCEEACGPANVRGEVIVADGCGADLEAIRASEAGHPLPDARGERATARLINLVKAPQAGGILCLLSGGASSLLVQPRRPLQLEDKIRTTELLLACGADIRELNTVRKHLSAVKGGGLVRYAADRMTTLLISDVVGDDVSVIGSGPTAPDPSTFVDAWSVLERYQLTEQVPAAVGQVLEAGMAGRVPETVKPSTPEAAKCQNILIGSNRTALEGAARAARARGYTVIVNETPLSGDTTQAARRFGTDIAARAAHPRGTAPLCILAGGETTVRVKGTGRGGRNQEFALALAAEIAGKRVLLLSAGTDGVDGPTDAAGAFADGSTLRRAHQRGLSPDQALADNDSYAFFSALGDLFRCGPTRTNVMDVKVALIPAPDLSVPGSD